MAQPFGTGAVWHDTRTEWVCSELGWSQDPQYVPGRGTVTGTYKAVTVGSFLKHLYILCPLSPEAAVYSCAGGELHKVGGGIYIAIHVSAPASVVQGPGVQHDLGAP